MFWLNSVPSRLVFTPPEILQVPTPRHVHNVETALPSFTNEGRKVLYVATLKDMVKASKALNNALSPKRKVCSQLPTDLWSEVYENAGEASLQLPPEPPKAVIGLDCEWKPSFKKGERAPVALLQVAASDVIAVFHLNQIGRMCEPLTSLLCRSDVLKVGVRVKTDAEYLQQDYMDDGSKIEGILDLSILARHVLGAKLETHCPSLALLCERLLGRSMNKSRSLRCSNWEDDLSDDQLQYAANDACASLLIALELFSAGSPCAIVRAMAGVRPPSKMKRIIWDLFYKKSLPVEKIAEENDMRASVVRSHLYDCIRKVWDYNFDFDLEHLLERTNNEPGLKNMRRIVKAVADRQLAESVT